MQILNSISIFLALGGTLICALAWVRIFKRAPFRIRLGYHNTDDELQAWYSIHAHPISSVSNAGVLAPFSRLLWALPSEFRGRITLDLPRLHELHGKMSI